MTIWTILIYAVAALLAIQSLLAMMTASRRQMVRQRFEEELARRQKTATRSPANPTEPESPKPSPKTKAA